MRYCSDQTDIQMQPKLHPSDFVAKSVADLFVHALHPSQQFFSHVETYSSLPGLNQYYAEDKVSCSQHSASGESRTGDPLIPV